jgi:hypothetical protein
MLRSHLAIVERHVAQGWKVIERQDALLRRLAARGHDLSQANEMMKVLLEAQELHEEHRLRLMQELESS